ncbi:MAG: rhodanese-like domain-containing protein [Candidatus Coatesbacteria bacterium]|nr:rhodanese-like domain-containing protein [Candidatus Coatesbacteria bacterium]
MPNMKVFVKRLIVRSLCLVVIASGVGLIVNAVRTPGVDLFGFQPPKEKIVEASKKSEEAVVTVIKLAEALRLRTGQGVIFIDARKVAEYEAGHIPGAINIPSEGFDEAFPSNKQAILSAEKIVTYCSDVECDEAYELAEMLREELKRPILVFAGGIKEYQGKGPIEK